MSKKGYQINVLNADDIKNTNSVTSEETINNQTQNLAPNQTQNQTSNQTPNQISNQTPNQVQNQVQNQIPKQEKPKELKTGMMIGGLITFFLSLCFFLYTLYYLFQTYNPDDSVQQALTFIVFILTIGWISFIPGIICSIISLCLNPFVIRSTSKGQKAVGIIFTILSVLMIIAFLFIAIYISALPSN